MVRIFVMNDEMKRRLRREKFLRKWKQSAEAGSVCLSSLKMGDKFTINQGSETVQTVSGGKTNKGNIKVDYEGIAHALPPTCRVFPYSNGKVDDE